MQSALAILHNAVYAEIANEPIGIWPGMALAMPVLLMGTMLNERKLIADFGDESWAYQQRASMLVPWKWLRQWIGEKH